MIIQSGGIASSPNTSNDMVRIFTVFLFQQLRLGFRTDHGLKTRDHVGIWVRSYNRANDIVGVDRIVDPVSNGLICCVFECFTARLPPLLQRPTFSSGQRWELGVGYPNYPYKLHILCPSRRKRWL